MHAASPTILGLAGTALNADEIAFFKAARPVGYILFARNVESPDQVRRLTDSLRSLAGSNDLPILIDQEGGRVRRLRPPHWLDHPPAQVFGQLHHQDPAAGLEACRLSHRAMGSELAALGITLDCAPVSDLAHPNTHKVIGDRAFDADPDIVAALAAAALEGLAEAGVSGLLKHIPGHGRTLVDSHDDLPLVDASEDELTRSDFRPFRTLATKTPWAMTGHLLFTALDRDRPSTQSADTVQRIIRGHIGFEGALMTDDISMQALSGSIAERCRLSLAAGCDLILHCNGKMEEMEEVLGASGSLDGQALKRVEAALARQPVATSPQDAATDCAARDALLSKLLEKAAS